MTVTLAQMKNNLLTFDSVIDKLEATEPLTDTLIDASTKTSIRLEPGWAEEAKNSGMTDVVPAYITINGDEHQFTKEGILQATALTGLRSSFVLKTPEQYIEAPMNWYFNSGLGEASHKLVVVRGLASSFIRPTIVPFSNIELATAIYDAVQERYGNDTEVLADFKFLNSLNRTDVRFIVPSNLRVMRDTDMIDVPQDSADVWSYGVNLTNSLTGKSKTSIESYMFRWWCSNGAIRENDEVGTWNRRMNGQVEESVYEWAAGAVDAVFEGMDNIFEQIQALNNIKLKGATADVLTKVYSDHKVPVTQRNKIQDDLLAANDITMYSLMNAVTSQANDPTLAPERVDKMMRIGGGLPEHYFDDTKAKIFTQGQNAGPDAVNPYLVQVD